MHFEERSFLRHKRETDNIASQSVEFVCNAEMTDRVIPQLLLERAE